MADRTPDDPRQPRPLREVMRTVPVYAKPFYFLSWATAALAYEVYRSPLLALAKIGAAFALPVAALGYCAETTDRHRDRVYRTWEVLTKAQGEAASGARYEALQDLAENNVSLGNVQVPGAWLEDIDLRGADLRFANLSRAYLAGAKLGCRWYWRTASTHCVRLRRADLRFADLARAKLELADLSLAHIDGVDLSDADLRGANLNGVLGWQLITGWTHADLRGARNAPSGLLDSAMKGGALVSVSR